MANCFERPEMAGYEVLLTVDQGIPHQWSSMDRRIALILLRAPTNQLEDLLPAVGAIRQAVDTIQPGQLVSVPLG